MKWMFFRCYVKLTSQHHVYNSRIFLLFSRVSHRHFACLFSADIKISIACICLKVISLVSFIRPPHPLQCIRFLDRGWGTRGVGVGWVWVWVDGVGVGVGGGTPHMTCCIWYTTIENPSYFFMALSCMETIQSFISHFRVNQYSLVDPSWGNIPNYVWQGVSHWFRKLWRPVWHHRHFGNWISW